MNEIETLNRQLLSQSFDREIDSPQILTHYQEIALMYSLLENAIAVLSDLKSNKSYIYYGGIAKNFGLSIEADRSIINSIWEEDIISKIHFEDTLKKHLLELRFFHYLKDIPANDRCNYYTSIILRMKDVSGEYVKVQHRMFYANEMNHVRLALCLYSFANHECLPSAYDGIIVNSKTGEVIKATNTQFSSILSDREKQVLKSIASGKRSKEIANLLHISINTVNRHRQNILEKLRVKNSVEAYRVAEMMGLL